MYRQRKRIMLMAEYRVDGVGLTHLETVSDVTGGNVDRNEMTKERTWKNFYSSRI